MVHKNHNSFSLNFKEEIMNKAGGSICTGILYAHHSQLKRQTLIVAGLFPIPLAFQVSKTSNCRDHMFYSDACTESRERVGS